MKNFKIFLISFLCLTSILLYSAPEISIIKFQKKNKKINLAFKLSGVANQELIALILSSQAVRIMYKLSLQHNRGFLRSDKRIWGDHRFKTMLKYNKFSRVFTVIYISEYRGRVIKKTRKRFIRPRSLRKTIKLILKFFFNKSYFINIPISNINPSEEDYFVRINAYINSVKLAPPYDIINSSFNFQIEKKREL